MLIDFTGDFFSQGLGSKYSFQAYGFTFNKYAGFGQKQVLAYNLYLCGTGGERRSTGIAYTARITNYADIRRDVTWTDTCLQHNWNTG
jgi:hypothetical protein